MIAPRLLEIILLTIVALYAVKKIIFAILNLRALNQYRKSPDSISQRQGIVYNKRTKKLEADQSPILPYK